MAALDGLLVVALEQAVAAPLCTARLADGGARVVKIERESGDTARHYDDWIQGESAYFTWLNRGKQSAVLDVKNPDDLELLHRMASRADVFVQNLAPGAAARLGVSARELASAHRSLIAVDIVGYGRDTSYGNMRAYDLLVQGEAGICEVTGTPADPCKVGVSIADIATGMNAHALVLEALLERARTGRGQAIEVAMFDGMADMMSVPLLHHAIAGRCTPRCGLAHASIRPYGVYRCCGGKEVVIAIQNAFEWARFCTGVLGREALIHDSRFASNPVRVLNHVELDATINEVFRTLSAEDVVKRLDKNQIAWGRVSTVAEASTHPALRHLQAVMPDGVTIAIPRPAGRSGNLPTNIPGLGAHTRQIRAEFSTSTVGASDQ